MKLTLFISLLLFVTVSFKSVTDKSPAIVEQEQGVFIFIKSKPVADYQYLGSVKKGMALTGAPAEMLKSMLSKCKKEYPQADGLIFNSIDMDKADCVKFK